MPGLVPGIFFGVAKRIAGASPAMMREICLEKKFVTIAFWQYE
jgi:prephenate dehydrogenase